jgi:hypothetical protein
VKRISFLGVVVFALLLLAVGAWIVQGLKAVAKPARRPTPSQRPRFA